MAEDLWEDKDSKTEDATEKKKEDAIKKGQVIQSKEVSNLFMLSIFTLIFVWILPYSMSNIAIYFKNIIINLYSYQINEVFIGQILTKTCLKLMAWIVPMFLALVAVVFVSSFAQQGTLVFSAESMIPDISKLSLIKGFKKMFSMKSLLELVKGVIKITCVGIIIYLVVMQDVSHLRLYQDFTISQIISHIYDVVKHIMFATVICTIALAMMDYAYQRFKYFQDLKMTKQEVKDESKDTEGDPQVKQRLRRVRREKMNMQIKRDVPKSTVVVTNPTHYAVALTYDIKTMATPVVSAKGLDEVALFIRKTAEENKIPIVENPLLARSLYNELKVKDAILEHHYKAVAKIIRWVYDLKDSKKK